MSLAGVAFAKPNFIDLNKLPIHTVVDQEKGQYLGHVSTVLLKDNKTILAVYPKGHGRGPITYKKSTDGGITWSERLPTPKNWETSKETPTIHLVPDPKTGGEHLILWSGLYPARIAESADMGNTWTELKPVGDWGGIVVMGAVEPMKDGRLVSWFHDDGRFLKEGGKASGTFKLLQTESTDGGRNWSSPKTIWQGSDMHLCEPGVVRSPDGKTLAMMLRENRRRQYSHIMFSSDEGKTFTNPKPMHPYLTGDRHTMRYAPDGRLLVTFRDMAQGSPYWGDWVAWVGTWDDVLNNQPGQYKIRIKDNKGGSDCAYPGLEILPDGTFVTTTYGHWEDGEQPYILSARFDMDMLDKLGRIR